MNRRSDTDLIDEMSAQQLQHQRYGKGKTNMKKTMKTLFAAVLALSLFGCASEAAPASTASTSSTTEASAETSADASSAKTGVNSTYAYLLDSTDLVKPELDLSNATGTLKNILDAGVLVIATSPDAPPGQFIAEDGETVMGSEMIMAKYIADVLGVDLKIETMDFSAVLTAVSTGKVDLAMAGFGYKKDRAENFELSHGYSGTHEASCHGLLVLAEDYDKYQTLADFEGVHVLAQASSLQQMYAEDEIPNVDLELVASLDQGILNMTAGKAQAFALSCSTADQYAKTSDGALVRSSVEFDLTPYEAYAGTVCAARKGDTEFMDVLNQIIDVINENEYFEAWWQLGKEQAGIAD